MQDMAGVLQRLKKHSITENTTVLAIEYDWDHILQEVDGLLSQLGFTYFSYSVTAIQLPGSDNDNIIPSKHGVMSGSLPNDIATAYIRDIAYQDPSLDKLASQKEAFVASTSSLSSCSVADSFWEQHGIHSRSYVPMQGRNSDYWFHYFGLYHSLPEYEFQRFYEDVSKWLVPTLNRYHAILQTVSEQEQNPFLVNDILSPTCLQVLRMTAQGMAVKKIADNLKLTEEGITYHITRAKRLFGAKNKTHLIAILYEIGLM